jgi:hypothetical protein
VDTKLRIDLSQGTLEVEGSETFVRDIYNDYKDRMSKITPVIPKKTNGEQKAKPEAPAPPKTKPRQSKKETLSIVKELNLAEQGDKPSLKDFFSKYNPSNNFERNLIFVYYLQNTTKVAAITSDHIFTCYRHVGVKIPGAFKQSLWDTASQKGWIDTSSLEDIKLTTQGINYLEHDIAKVG